jgi:uncharacterized protein YfbU (UPF0304 family)
MLLFTLTKAERLLLINQHRILEKLYPQDAAAHAHTRDALERGFPISYPAEIDEALSEREAQEVLDVLSMYLAITRAVNALASDDALRTNHNAQFQGFDGNYEGNHFAYAQYCIKQPDKWDELKGQSGDRFNSHEPMLPTYLAMLEVWASLRANPLTREGLQRILEARPG